MSWKAVSLADASRASPSLLPLLRNLLVTVTQENLVFKSSGTSGAPKTLAKSPDPLNLPERQDKGHWLCAYSPESFAAWDTFKKSAERRFLYASIHSCLHSMESLPDSLTGELRISLTPTQLKLLGFGGFETSLRFHKVFLGGEAVQASDLNFARKLFNAQEVYNIYGTSEHGALLASKNSFFTPKHAISSKLSWSDSGELLVEGNDGTWMSTHDLFEESPEGWRFIGRKDRAFKVGGNTVLPEKIEQLAESYPGVDQAVVTPLESRLTGSVCQLELTVTDKALFDEAAFQIFLQKQLSRFELPHFINVSEAPRISRAGKKR